MFNGSCRFEAGPVKRLLKEASMEKLQKIARITALAFSVVFELMAGPFLGYFIGSYLVKKMGMRAMAVSIGIFIGFMVSFYAAMLTIMEINKLDKSAGKDQTRD